MDANVATTLRSCRAALGDLTRTRQPAAMAEWIQAHLEDHVIAFWERHGIDERGGILTCLDETGAVLSTEKWLWSQWRAVWVFSRLYNQLERRPPWLAHARQIARFCIAHGWDAAGGWALLVSREGRILRGRESTYVDAFAVYALAELYRACGDDDLLPLLRRSADRALIELNTPHDTLPHFPYPIPAGARPHGIPMLWSLSLAHAGAVLRDERYLAEARRLSDEIFSQFYRRDRDVVVEFLRLDGSEFPGPQGSAVVPGHVIENMWFQIQIAPLIGSDARRIDDVLHLILRHLELGWDYQRNGGLLLAVDANGNDTVGWNFADTKLWWPHTEALYATLLGWQHTGQPVFLAWYERLWKFCLQHFVDWENGDWRQKLDRDCQPLNAVVALPVKDPFHLPRSLLLQLEALNRPPPPPSNA